MIYQNIADTIGNTPLVKLNFNEENIADVFVKVESFNPSGSVKDRATYYILQDLLSKGTLKNGGTIIEATSGNTGVALSMMGAALGIKVILVMPETMTVERRNLMAAYGAEIVLTPGTEGMAGATKKAESLSAELNAPIFGQFSNPANIQAHFETTAKEILSDLGHVDGFVAGVGTGGTVSGTAKGLKESNAETVVWAVEPEESALISKGVAGPHKIQGIGANFIPDNFDAAIIDTVVTVSSEDAMAMTRKLAKEFGILAGVSAGANVTAALRLAKTLGAGKQVVTVLPDTGERYLSTGIFNA
ncbi:cysteine synthase A [Aerococcaceae bacterium zg-ZJ1578]|uniref:cysteine synthase A n=1 Tax=Aerococcaceae TaxID=186827 RepID=UPI0013B6940D|nr:MULTISPECIES: cysteine synthase A [unclassified Facklamia]MBK0348526.1 cysteine synthase A [Aerococcaceae bacterium zg-1578]QQD66163.1 cysteine synthase A [Aerococcaceae bacterium zg-252]NEW65255.1 cysteine synthase A [Facklamia sp. 252]NEW65324.1 cysteine synthase A [Facklamia sp. 252]NEW68344.1 cysteine synthase A [Facklamia sp. 253]